MSFVPLAATLGHLATFLWYSPRVGESSCQSTIISFQCNSHVSSRFYLIQSNNLTSTHMSYNSVKIRFWEDHDQLTWGPQVGPHPGQLRSRCFNITVSREMSYAHPKVIPTILNTLSDQHDSEISSALVNRISRSTTRPSKSCVSCGGPFHPLKIPSFRTVSGMRYFSTRASYSTRIFSVRFSIRFGSLAHSHVTPLPPSLAGQTPFLMMRFYVLLQIDWVVLQTLTRCTQTNDGQIFSDMVLTHRTSSIHCGSYLLRYVLPSKQRNHDWANSTRIGEAQNPGPSESTATTTQLTFSLLNPTTIYQKEDGLLGLNSDVLCLAETAATRNVQTAFNQAIRTTKYQTYWSAQVPDKITKTDPTLGYTLRGDNLGTAIMTRLPSRDARHTFTPSACGPRADSTVL